jgi:hypothetical protein
MLIKLFKYYFLIQFHVLLHSQQSKYIFFDFYHDSIKARNALVTIPTQGNAGCLTNSILTDYYFNTRIKINTGIIASKKDTMLAIHSLFNGIGNLSMEFESPLWFCYINRIKKDFIGLSFNPRLNSMVGTDYSIQKSSLCYDIGLNIIFKVSGDLGSTSIKIVDRNSFATGNYEFISKIYGVKNDGFFFNTLQIRIKGISNMLSLNFPIFILPINSKAITGFPAYAGFGVQF